MTRARAGGVTGRRLMVAVAGFVGAEILGAVGCALAAGLLAFDPSAPAVAAIVLALFVAYLVFVMRMFGRE